MVIRGMVYYCYTSIITELWAADTMLEAPMTAESAVDMMAARVEQVIIVTRKYWNHPPPQGSNLSWASAASSLKM